MPINAQRPSSNTNKPQSRQNIFSSQSHASLEPRHPTSGLVDASPRATNSRPAGARVSHFSHVIRVRPVKARRELGNLLVVAPTRGGKGLLATAQLLTWRHSVVVNDIKGDLFAQTAG